MGKFKDNICTFFDKFSLKIKLILGTLAGIIGFFLVFFVSKKINAKQILELELKKVEEEINIKNTEKDISKNKELISELDKKAKAIKSEIRDIDLGNKPENISREEMDTFFSDRGF